MDEMALVLKADYLIKMGLAVLLGALIGLEREYHGRPAGLRTHILVCLGSTLLIIASKSLPTIVGNTSFVGNFVIDPARLAAGIITGIGFLGAGVVLKTKDFIRGVTTAACIWFAAVLGIIIGMGFYAIAAISTVIAVVVLLFLAKISSTIYAHTYKHVIVVVHQENFEGFSKTCEKVIAEHDVTVLDRDYRQDNRNKEFALDFYIRSSSHEVGFELARIFGQMPGVLESSIQ